MKKIIAQFRSFFTAVRDVNSKYKEPHIRMTRTVALSLFMLRLYLFFIVAILLLKFISLAAKGGLGVIP